MLKLNEACGQATPHRGTHGTVKIRSASNRGSVSVFFLDDKEEKVSFSMAARLLTWMSKINPHLYFGNVEKIFGNFRVKLQDVHGVSEKPGMLIFLTILNRNSEKNASIVLERKDIRVFSKAVRRAAFG